MLLAITIKRRAMPALSIIPLTNWRCLAFWEYLFVQNRGNLPRIVTNKCSTRSFTF
jgi:hypothetical protein